MALDPKDRPDPAIAQGWLRRAAAQNPNDVLNAKICEYARVALAQFKDTKAVATFAGTFLDGKQPG